MEATLEVMEREAGPEGTASCAACGGQVPDDTGLAVRFESGVLHLGSADGLAHLRADPWSAIDDLERATGAGAAEQSPCSEWACY